MTPQKILVLDDSKLMHKMFEVMLRAYRLVYASDGRQGLQRLDVHTDVDLILLDPHMPNMNGAEFMEEIRKRPDRPRVIVITAQGWDTEPIEGADAAIVKPFSQDEILAKIAALPERATADR